MDKTMLVMPVTSQEQLEHIHKAEEALGKAGVTFDSSSDCDDDGKVLAREWQLDWSLKGATLAGTRLVMPVTSEEQRGHLFEAQGELRKAGVNFDSGSDLAEGMILNRCWELDYSLEGAELK